MYLQILDISVIHPYSNLSESKEITEIKLAVIGVSFKRLYYS